MSNAADGAMGLIGTAFSLAMLGVATQFMMSMMCQFGDHMNCQNPRCQCEHHKRKQKVKSAPARRMKNPYNNVWYKPWQ